MIGLTHFVRDGINCINPRKRLFIHGLTHDTKPSQTGYRSVNIISSYTIIRLQTSLGTLIPMLNVIFSQCNNHYVDN